MLVEATVSEDSETVTAFIAACLWKGRGGRCLSVRHPPTHRGLQGNPELACPFAKTGDAVAWTRAPELPWAPSSA